LRQMHYTVFIRIVADFGSQIFQFTTNVIADYNVYTYYCFRLLFLYLLGVRFSIFQAQFNVIISLIF
jgi:hypothetical protein